MPKFVGANCNGCPLEQGRSCAPSGPLQADILFVGEYPGEEEVAANYPFIGTSGQILRGALSRAGLDGYSMRFTNLIRCYEEDAEYGDAEERCAGALDHEIRQTRPKLVVGLGKTISNRLLGLKNLAIGALRGHEVWSEKYNCWIFPMNNPAIVLYSSIAWLDVERDLRQIASVVELPPRHRRRAPQPRMRSINTKEDLIKLCKLSKSFLSGKRVALDIETQGLDIYNHKILTIGWSTDDNSSFTFPAYLLYGHGDWDYPALEVQDRIPYNDAYLALKDFLEDESISFVTANGKFDCKFIRYRLGIKARADEDLLLKYYSLDSRLGRKSLKYLSREFLKSPNYDKALDKFKVAGHKGNNTWDVIPYKDLTPYQGLDISYTKVLDKKFSTVLDQNPKQKELYYNLLLPLQEALINIEQRGVFIDMSKLDTVRESVENKLRSIYSDILSDITDKPEEHKIWFEEKSKFTGFNPNSNPQVQKMLYEEMGLPLQHSRQQKPEEVPKGSADVEALGNLRQLTDSPFIPAMLEWRKFSKLYGTYVNGLEGEISPDGRIHPDYNIAGSETGRLTGSRIMTIPKPDDDANIRSLFSVDPNDPRDLCVMQVDYSQCEIRVATVFSGDPYWTEKLINDEDLHKATAILLYGYEDEKTRKLAKTINFGIIYKLSPDSLSRREDMTLEEATDYINAFYSTLSGLKSWQTMIERLTLARNYIITTAGRKRDLGLVTRSTRSAAKRLAVNNPIQSDANDMCLRSCIELELDDPVVNPTYYTAARELKNLNAEILLLNHDAFLYQLPKASVENAMPIIREVMESQGKRFLKTSIPFKVDFEVGDSWGNLKKI